MKSGQRRACNGWHGHFKAVAIMLVLLVVALTALLFGRNFMPDFREELRDSHLVRDRHLMSE